MKVRDAIESLKEDAVDAQWWEARKYRERVERERLTGVTFVSAGGDWLQIGVWGMYKDDAPWTKGRLRQYEEMLRHWKQQGVYDGGTVLIREGATP